MFHSVETLPRRLRAYHGIIDDKLYTEILELAPRLRGLRVLHVNSTSTRGGIPEILGGEIPLMRDIGILADWQTFNLPKSIYAITKYIHNGLQGSSIQLSQADWQRYEEFNKKLAAHIKPDDWDVIFIHDGQPAPLVSYLKDKGSAKWIWRCHMDLTQPDTSYQKRFIQYLKPYDGVIFHTPEYGLAGYRPPHKLISAAAIDPLNPKNLPMSETKARQILKSHGLDIHRPIVTHLSRFDPWKDIPGAIEAWQLARQTIPGLQLNIVGMLSSNDVQGRKLVQHIRSLIKGETDAHLFVNGVVGRASKAFFVGSDILLHKSIREGFSMTVSEALWSFRPVIGGNVGGIRLQIINGKDGYLVNNAQECAERIVTLLQNKELAAKMGNFGHEYVRQHFLLPRLLRDEMRFMIELLAN